MIRNCSLDEISDGRLYSANDMVKADCNDCEGCSACCQGMGGSIVLDPYDIYQLTKNLSCSFEQLLATSVTLNVVDGLILPNLKMDGEKESCVYLNGEGRCSIHGFRPGICRLFPLGRYWDENGDFHYILQTNECKKENRSKIKVKKWLDVEDLNSYHIFIKEWHSYINYAKSEIAAIQQKCVKTPDDKSLAQEAEKQIRSISMYTLNTFFATPYLTSEFYQQFQQRMEQTKKILSI